MLKTLLIIVLLHGQLLAQEREISVNLLDLCPFNELQLKQNNQITPEQACSDKNNHNQSIEQIFKLANHVSDLNLNVNPCQKISQLSLVNTPPIELSIKDEDNQNWKIKFFFGFSRTKYFNTDMHLQSSRMDVVIKDFEFLERTSAETYNPLTWTNLDRATMWIHEPTNTFAFTIENDKNAFYITAFHPKFLKKQFSEKHVTGTVDGVAVDHVMHINEPFDGYNNQLGEMYLIRFENTHKQMDWQVGYGRKIKLYEDPKKGKITYIPRVDVGLTSGQNYTVYTQPGAYWDYDRFRDKHRIQGINISAGNRVEYERKKMTYFIDQKFVHSRLEHGFMDGKASYKMNYIPVTFGIGFNLYQSKKPTN